MISWGEFHDFMAKYYRGDFPEQRLGQAFYNTYHDIVEDATDLFYCEDNRTASEIIVKRYVAHVS